MVRTQHRVRAAAGCAHNGRPTGTGAGHRMPISSSSRIKFHGAGISGAPGSGQLGKVLCHRHRSQWRPIRASAQMLSDQCPQPGEKIQKGGAGRQAAGSTDIASCLFANGRGHQKRRRRLRSLKGLTSRGKNSEPFGNGSSIGLTFSATTKQPFELSR